MKNINDINTAFSKGKALITYLMAGDPFLENTRDYIIALDKGGADIIELGIPFSDPIAEGPTIQAANLRAIASNTDISGVLKLAGSLKGKLNALLMFMTYTNLLYSYGFEAFFAKCRECGISGVILPDLPFEEQSEVMEFADKYDVVLITLVAPTSGKRIEKIVSSAKGFIYLVSSMGVTGVRSVVLDQRDEVAEIRKHTDIPVAVGFGIHNELQAAEITDYADGIIIGSAVVEIIAEYGAEAGAKLESYVRRIKQVINPD
jgi:tryptophan synthase alpha chain